MAPRSTTLTVLRSERITDHLIRVVLGGPGFDEFVPSGFTDSYVKLEYTDDDGDTVLRTYTIRSVDRPAREIAIDFVVHGDEGIAGPWARRVEAGETIVVRGPGGAYSPDASADWHLLVGDETALPAIATAVEALPDDARGYVVVEVAGPGDEIDLTVPSGVSLRWVHRGGAAGDVGDDLAGAHAPLVAAVLSLEWLPGRAHVFAHGEAEAIMHHIRPYVRKERGVPASDASVSGYWRRGRTEEGFRVWKRDLAAAEA